MDKWVTPDTPYPTRYVLKKMECRDEAEANNAFKEAKALQELAHPYICGYKENFVSWDREEGAMFVCIVMEYYPLKDLEVGHNLSGTDCNIAHAAWFSVAHTAFSSIARSVRVQ